MDTPVAITGVESPAGLFTGPEDTPHQVVRVTLRRRGAAGPLAVSLAGRHVVTDHPRLLRSDPADPAPAGADETAEVAIRTPGVAPDETLAVTARITTPDGRLLAARDAEIRTAEPGWTMRLVPHFHYDPMWWNTQAAYTALWDAQPRPGAEPRGWEYTGVPAFTLIPLHLQQARDDPDYRFVLAELDYLKPFLDAHPQYAAELRDLIRAGRVELVGGTYNEPSTNLTGAETTVRGFQHGLAFHRAALGGTPRTAWQLDVFGHDPGFPTLAAGAGLDSAVFARGPHHHWGPMMDRWGDPLRAPTAMQLPAEFTWLGPGGGPGVLAHYLPAHYSAGWFSHAAAGPEEAAEQLHALFALLQHAAATRNVLIPMGTDFSWPHPWGLAVQHAWNRRYTWPRMVHSGPREHFAAVRAELAARGERPLPVTREMGPIYTGKDVSYADIKQANRAGESLTQQAETTASLVHALGLAGYPDAALDKAWRHLLHAAHHDAVTGTFSDQVYLDLLPTWREAYDLAEQARDEALRVLAERLDTRPPAGRAGPHRALTVANSLSWSRTDLVRTEVCLADLGTADPRRLAVLDDTGTVHPVLLEDTAGDRVRIAFLARDVPSLGHRTWWLTVLDQPRSDGWRPVEDASGPPSAANAYLRVEADPARGGGLRSITEQATGRELLSPGEVTELVVQEEYAEHPYFGEGPWHLLPKGPGTGSGARPALRCRAERGPLGTRVVSEGRTGPLDWTVTATLWDGLDRLDLATTVRDFTGRDSLVRLRVPADVPGALPVAETATAAVGRGFAFPDVDAGADHTRAPWTLDTPCLNWFGLSTPARVALRDADGAPVGHRAVGAAEVVLPDDGLPGYGSPDPATDPSGTRATDAPPDGLLTLVTALGRRGVTATPTHPDGTRWGDLAADSSLPDLRIVLGWPSQNAVAAAALRAAGPAAARAVADAERHGDTTPLLVPADLPLRDRWRPGCDLTGPRDLPVLLVPDPGQLPDLAAGWERDGQLAARLVPTEETASAADHQPHPDRTVALLVRGTPGCAVDTAGRLHSSLLRASTGRPSGSWMDPPHRTAPDGSAFQLQHWTQTFEHALVAADGDWRAAGLPRRGREFTTPLSVVATPPAAGPRPAHDSLLTVGPDGADGRVQVETVTRAGPGTLAVRLRETHGSRATARLRTALPVLRARATDLLDGAPTGGAADGAVPASTPLPGDATEGFPVDLEPLGYRTVLLDHAPVRHADPPPAEPLTPAFSRYWLHNTGTAPQGGAPLAVTVHPGRLEVDGGPLCATVRGTGPDTELTVTAPTGWHARCEPGAEPDRRELTVEVPPDAAPGDHLVRVTARDDGHAVEDCLTVTVPGAATPPGLELSVTGEPAPVAPGERTEVRVRIANSLHSDVRLVAIAVSPYGTWRMMSPAARPLTVPARGSAEAVVEVEPPPGTVPGTFWVLVKAAGDGLFGYSPAAAVQVTEARTAADEEQHGSASPAPS